MVTPLPCPNVGCEQLIIKRLLVEHSTKECGCSLLKCLFCQTTIRKKDYLDHVSKEHTERLRGLMHYHSNEVLPPKLQLTKKLSASMTFKFDPLFQGNNRAGRLAKRGTTGNYYCRADVGLRGGCGCDGNCGPNNGCCCVDCMRLTLEAQGIKCKNILVNPEGRLVKV